MAELSYVFTDAALTTAFNDSTPLSIEASSGNSADSVVYVGLTDTGRKIQAQSDPGVDPITVTIADSSAGSGVATTDIKLATSSAGLDSATAGAALSLGTAINGGAANRAEVHIRWTNDSQVGTSTEISLTLVALEESAV